MSAITSLRPEIPFDSTFPTYPLQTLENSLDSLRSTLNNHIQTNEGDNSQLRNRLRQLSGDFLKLCHILSGGPLSDLVSYTDINLELNAPNWEILQNRLVSLPLPQQPNIPDQPLRVPQETSSTLQNTEIPLTGIDHQIGKSINLCIYIYIYFYLPYVFFGSLWSNF